MDEDGGNYGPLKALCEHAVAEVFPRRHSNIRAGLLVGAHDPTGRFTYWPHRVARGGQVLAPAPPERKVQFVDVRDLARWLVDLTEGRVPGTFNATHPGRPWGDVLETAREVSGSDAAFTWVPDAFLAEHEVGEWMELPLWLRDPEWIGMHMADVFPAIEAGAELELPAARGDDSRGARTGGADRRGRPLSRARGGTAQRLAIREPS